MAFRLHGSDGAVTEYGDRASYAFNITGHLVVTSEAGVRLTYSPNAWHHLEDHPGGSGAFR